MNKSILIGRTTREPDIRTTTSGKKVATFTLAVDRDFKSQSGEREADFIPCVAWGKLAEIVERYVPKGKQIAVCGRIQTRNYDAPDGSKRYITEIIVSELQLLGSKQEQPQEPMLTEIEDDELPF